jgi:hypothetical protein
MAQRWSRASGESRRGFSPGEMIFLVGVLAVFLAGMVVVVGDGVDRYRPESSTDPVSGQARTMMARLATVIEQARTFYLSPGGGAPADVEGLPGAGALTFEGDLEGDGKLETVILHRAGGGGRTLVADVRSLDDWRRVELTDRLDAGDPEPFSAVLLGSRKAPAPHVEGYSPGDEVTGVRYTVRFIGEKGPRSYSRTVSLQRPASVEQSAP